MIKDYVVNLKGQIIKVGDKIVSGVDGKEGIVISLKPTHDSKGFKFEGPEDGLLFESGGVEEWEFYKYCNLA